MPPRRVKKAVSEDSSDLSSAPSEVEEPAKVVQGTKRKRAPPKKKAAASDQPNGDSATVITKKPRATAKQLIKSETEAADDDDDDDDNSEPAVKKPKGKKAAKKEPEGGKKAPTKRKTKEEKEAEAMPLATRTIGHKMVIGAHVSAAGGVQNATVNAVHIGANAFALFLKSQRKWTNPPLDPTVCTSFHNHCKEHSYDQNKHVVPHGSYLVNLAHTDKDRTKQAYDCFLDDLRRCEKLGITLYNFHPGNALTTDRAEAIKHLATSMNRAHKETSTVVTLLETMAAGGNVLGSTFEDLRDIISHIDDKSRVGVCLDTCHVFAAGYDIRDKAALDATLAEFDETVGMKYLRALHLNDSKAPFRGYRDLHANIGTGFIGLRGFHAVVNEPRFEGLPMVLETPIEVRDEKGVLVKDEKSKTAEDKGIWAREIKMLESFVGIDPESKEFKELSEKLQLQGAPERLKILEQVEKREQKKVVADAKANAKAIKGVKKAPVKAKAKLKQAVKDEEAASDDGSDSS